MPIIIAPAYVTEKTPDANNPHIGYQTWVRDRSAVDITASSETASGPKDAPLRPDTSEFWQGNALPAEWVIDLGQPRPVDYIGLAGHTIGSSGKVAFLKLPGASGNYASTPDAAPLDIVGDIDLRAQVALDDWTPVASQEVISKSLTTGNQRGYRLLVLSTGALQLQWSADGTAVISKDSTVSVGFADGLRKWIRATLDVDNGAAGNDVKFYTSDDGETWTQLGATVTTAGVTSIFSNTSPLELGATEGGTVFPLAGKIYAAQVYSGIAGTLVFNANFKKQLNGTESFFELSSNAAVVTVNQSGDPKAEITSQPTVLKVEHSPDNSVWTQFASDLAPADDTPIMLLDASISRRYWKITFTGAGDVPALAIVYIGSMLVNQHPVYGGHGPAVLARDTRLYQNMSDGGQFLGQYIRRQGVVGSVDLKRLTAARVRSSFDPFVKSARKFPFFFAWRPVDYPLEVAFVWTKDNIQPTNMGIRDLMQTQLSFRGIGYAD